MALNSRTLADKSETCLMSNPIPLSMFLEISLLAKSTRLSQPTDNSLEQINNMIPQLVSKIDAINESVKNESQRVNNLLHGSHDKRAIGVGEMTEDIFRKRPILGNRILTPIKDNITESRPVVETKSPSVQTNSNLEISENNQNDSTKATNNMNNSLDASLSAIQNLIDSGNASTPKKEVVSNDLATLATPTKVEAAPTNTQVSVVGNNSAGGNSFFKFPAQKPPFGGNIHSLKWTGNKYQFIEAAGSTSDYVRFNNWHLHGATVWIGTSATGAVEKVGLDPASGVTGLIPQATKQIAELIRSTKELSEGKTTDPDGRPFQFAVVTVLGGQDHKALCESFRSGDVNKTYRPVFESLGIEGISLKTALYNPMGELFALEVSF